MNLSVRGQVLEQVILASIFNIPNGSFEPDVIISVVTSFWKISLHTSMNTVGSILLNLLFGWNLPVIYLVVPIVLWARITLKRHTFIQ